MSARPRLDDPAALVALLDQLSASPAVRTALSNKGFASLGSLAFAVSDMSDADEVRLFLRSTLSLADTDDAALVSADSACIRRLLFEASSAAPPKPALGTAALPPAPTASALLHQDRSPGPPALAQELSGQEAIIVSFGVFISDWVFHPPSPAVEKKHKKPKTHQKLHTLCHAWGTLDAWDTHIH